MNKKKVFELAKDLGISSKELMAELKKLKVEVKSHMNVLEDKTVGIILEKFKKTDKSEAKKDIPKEKVKLKVKEKVKEEIKVINPKGILSQREAFGSGKEEPVKVVKEEPKKEIKKEEIAQPEIVLPKKEIITEPVKIEVKPKPVVEKPAKPTLKINESITTGELAKKLQKNPAELIKKLIEMGKMVTINQVLDNDTVSIIVDEYGYSAEIIPVLEDDAVLLIDKEETTEKEFLEKRPPVVTMMGHVDHGKTSLLDAIRKTNVASGESGGITQHIGAYTVKLENGIVVFLDTPGHEAFTAMRARGAKATDIVVLVVAADDGVMPQTIEAIDHAKEAGVPIIVAVNKIDKAGANSEKVKQELSKLELIPEEWGGKTIFVEVSAKKETGINTLLEMLLLEAEMLELKANPKKRAIGTVIEARLDKGRGAVATVLVQDGTLELSDNFVAGLSYGKVRAMINDKGERVKLMGPSMPVEVLGFSSVALAGDKFIVVKDEKTAREINMKRQEANTNKKIHPVRHVSLDDIYKEIQEGKIKELKIIIKADVQGSIEPLKESLEQISNEKVKLKVIHSGVGNVNVSDIMLASASDAIIIGFHVKTEAPAEKLASEEGVDIRLYEIIYNVISDVKSAMEGLLEPTLKEVVIGKAEVRKVIKLSKEGVVIGVMVINGKITRADSVRIIRKGEVVFTGKLGSLKRFKDDVKEVSAGYECGIGMESFTNLKEQDIIEAFTMEKIKQKL